ncbi:hypothetical protein V5799_012078 [Amblyomma americanum]|uniref:THAP-type domain-containing protein n=1 Tax=Amblyomma americanum TaxID=6943 RepID=A0AAQ4EFG7_AMBAM
MSAPEARFHKFPGREYERERRQRWIAAVRRRNADGSPWVPTRNSRVCSYHFVDGKKSDDPRKPGYVPTIFPRAYSCSKAVGSKRLQRCDDSGSSVRQLLRPPDGRGVTRGGVKAGRKSVGTQTRRCVRYSEMDATNFFSCCRTGCDAQTQTDLARRKSDALATSFEVRTLHVMF